LFLTVFIYKSHIMKHLLNDLSEEVKNSIREQHNGGKKIVIENFNKLVNTKSGDVKLFLNEENISNKQCLIDAGFKLQSIGGPETRRTVYTNVTDGKTYQYYEDGTVRVFNNKEHMEGKWSCDSNSPKGVKVYDLKPTTMMPM